MSACDKVDQAGTDVIACERTYGVCPNVRVVTSDDITDCSNSLGGRCGLIMRQYIQCIHGECTDAGVVDRSATAGKCSLVLKAYRECLSTDASVGPGGDPATDPFLFKDGGLDAF